jgi:glycosyltransferase involved in cell wall biosynthesis
MKILLVVTKAEIGGAQNVVRDLATGLQESGHQVTVAFGGNDDYLPNQLNQHQIDWHRFDNLSRSKNPLKGLQFAFELKRFLTDGSYDLVHLHSSNALYGVLGSVWTKTKSVFTFHGMSVLAPGYRKNVVMKAVYAIYFAVLSRLLTGAVFLSENDRRIARSWFVRPPKSSIIPNGIKPESIDFLSRKEARNELADKTDIQLEDNILVGSVGRLSYQKNYQFLLRAAKMLQANIPQAKFIVIGDGPKQKELKEQVKERGLQDTCYFVGAIPDAARLLQAFDIFALTSRYEGLPLTLIEALFADVPILASDVGANREVVADTKRSLYQSGNLREFCEKLKTLIKNKDLRSETVSAQNKSIKQFKFASVLRKHIDFYQSV